MIFTPRTVIFSPRKRTQTHIVFIIYLFSYLGSLLHQNLLDGQQDLDFPNGRYLDNVHEEPIDLPTGTHTVVLPGLRQLRDPQDSHAAKHRILSQ